MVGFRERKGGVNAGGKWEETKKRWQKTEICSSTAVSHRRVDTSSDFIHLGHGTKKTVAVPDSNLTSYKELKKRGSDKGQSDGKESGEASVDEADRWDKKKIKKRKRQKERERKERGREKRWSRKGEKEWVGRDEFDILNGGLFVTREARKWVA